MVSRDSRGEVNANNRWKSQIISRANSVGVISVSVDKLTPQVEAERGVGGGGEALISSQPRRNNQMAQAYS